jgi:prepilin-type N-terminal cleavage/methylation domain-containing protein
MNQMNQRGFSLVEVVVAIMILAIGVVALGASAASITRITAEGGRTSEAAMIASARFERLRYNLCTGGSSAGNTVTDGFTETWTISSTSLLRTVTETITYSTGRGTRTVTYVTESSCAPSV